ncbi:MAG: U32 family peptidase, partial [Elusimicrobia bacterium]|nr:U32 family peptidase [Elusimicrobiota bacterium]
ACLKIEGRMKNAEYVYKTVKAYKLLAMSDESNCGEVLKEAKKFLDSDFARKKTTFNFISKSADVFSPNAKQDLSVTQNPDESFKDYLKNIISSVKIEKAAKKFTSPILMQTPNPAKPVARREKLFVKINDLSWLSVLDKVDVVIIIPANIKNIPAVKNDIFLELPPYIDEQNLHLCKNIKGNIIVNNISHFKLLENTGSSLHVGKWLYVTNHFAARHLKKLNVKSFTYSVEDDIKNISNIAKYISGGMVYLYGLAEVCISKMLNNSLKNNETIKSGVDEFCVIKNPNETLLLTKYPTVIFNKKRELLKAGVSDFIIDLSYVPKDETYLRLLLDAYNLKRPLTGAFSFNMERGLR